MLPLWTWRRSAPPPPSATPPLVASPTASAPPLRTPSMHCATHRHTAFLVSINSSPWRLRMKKCPIRNSSRPYATRRLSRPTLSWWLSTPWKWSVWSLCWVEISYLGWGTGGMDGQYSPFMCTNRHGYLICAQKNLFHTWRRTQVSSRWSYSFVIFQ